MRGRELIGRWQNVLGNIVKYTGILSKEADVEDLLWVAKPEMLKLRIESCVFGTEIRNAEAC